MREDIKVNGKTWSQVITELQVPFPASMVKDHAKELGKKAGQELYIPRKCYEDRLNDVIGSNWELTFPFEPRFESFPSRDGVMIPHCIIVRRLTIIDDTGMEVIKRDGVGAYAINGGNTNSDVAHADSLALRDVCDTLCIGKGWKEAYLAGGKTAQAAKAGAVQTVGAASYKVKPLGAFETKSGGKHWGIPVSEPSLGEVVLMVWERERKMLVCQPSCIGQASRS